MFQRDTETLRSLVPGVILAGQYRVERVMGANGMAVVAARQIGIEQHVVLKFPLPSLLLDLENGLRFAREAKIAARVESEHAARVLNVGVVENGAPFMVTEFLDGGDLGARLRARGPEQLQTVVLFILQACVALAEAHRQSIVHRDIKPSNLFCTTGMSGQPVIKVLDFGISRITAADSAFPGQPTVIHGSPYYMSPEQLQGSGETDARGDIWSLGVTLYELLSGRPPFQAGSLREIATKIATEEPLSVRNFRPDVPPELEGVIQRCLAKHPFHRFPNVAELAFALAPFGPPHAQTIVEQTARILDIPLLSNYRPAAPPVMDMEPEATDRQNDHAAQCAPATEQRTPTSRSDRMMMAGAALAVGLTLLLVSALVAKIAFEEKPTTSPQREAASGEPEVAHPELRKTRVAPEVPLPAAVEPRGRPPARPTPAR